MKTIKSFGLEIKTSPLSELERQLEEIKFNGFTVVPNIIPKSELKEVEARLDKIYETQIAEFGEHNFERLNELDTARALLAYDDFFIKYIKVPAVLALVEALLGKTFVLNLQNGIINKPSRAHHQSSWHRDLPYQNFVISKPLAINALFAVNDFTAKSGATFVIPGSHRIAEAPSAEFIEKFKITAEAPAGSAIVFDSMLVHCAGSNTGDFTRRAINHLYTQPIIAQQISLPQALKGRYSDNESLRTILGYDYDPSPSVIAWREGRQKRGKNY